MSKANKIWLITAAALVAIGILIFGGIMTVLGWDFTKLSISKFETNSYDISEEYKDIRIETERADIVFLPAKDSKTSVEFYEQTNARHSVSVENGALTIKLDDKRAWYEHIGINFTHPKITVYMPSGEYGELSVKSTTGDTEIAKDFKFCGIDLSVTTGDVKSLASSAGNVKIKTVTGDVCIEKAEARDIDISVTTGRISLSEIHCEDLKFNVVTGRSALDEVICKNLSSGGTTGDVVLKDVIVGEKLCVERTTGGVRFEGCDAAEIYVKATTGSVTGSLLTEKVFIVSTSTGRKEFPATRGGGKCEITTSTGDVIITLD